jgi:hypothetical protein
MLNDEVISVDIPMTFKKRGGRKLIVLPDGSHGHPEPAATIDNTMIKAIARAFRWQRLLENGTYTCLDDIARSEKIGASFVSRYHRLVLLAPDIVESILEGRQPAQLTMKDLLRPFPICWREQHSQFECPCVKVVSGSFSAMNLLDLISALEPEESHDEDNSAGCLQTINLSAELPTWRSGPRPMPTLTVCSGSGGSRPVTGRSVASSNEQQLLYRANAYSVR